MKLVVGLGNPGKQYAKTKHNIGRFFLDYFIHEMQLGSRTYEKKWQSDIIETQIKLKNQDTNKEKIYLNTEKVFFLKPQTYMNHSGNAVASIANFYQLKPNDILIIHDDIDLPLGTIKYKIGGGHGGHNGLKDIILKLGSTDLHRIRIGIGRPSTKQEVVDYVLSTFPQVDEQIIINKTQVIVDHIKSFLGI